MFFCNGSFRVERLVRFERNRVSSSWFWEKIEVKEE